MQTMKELIIETLKWRCKKLSDSGYIVNAISEDDFDDVAEKILFMLQQAEIKLPLQQIDVSGWRVPSVTNVELHTNAEAYASKISNEQPVRDLVECSYVAGFMAAKQTDYSTLLNSLVQMRISDFAAASRAETAVEYRALMDNVNALNHVLSLMEHRPEHPV